MWSRPSGRLWFVKDLSIWLKQVLLDEMVYVTYLQPEKESGFFLGSPSAEHPLLIQNIKENIGRVLFFRCQHPLQLYISITSWFPNMFNWQSWVWSEPEWSSNIHLDDHKPSSIHPSRGEERRGNTRKYWGAPQRERADSPSNHSAEIIWNN